MSEYKENTVGWWLSQLKEPLKSRAFGVYSKPEWLDRSAANICDATNILSWTTKGDTAFWDGVDAFFRQDVTRDHLYPSRWKGWDMAKECAPDNWLKPKDGGEDKAIVDSPEKPKNWIDQELWKWHTDMVKGGVEYANAERGKVKLVAESPAPIAFEWNDNSVIDFTTWNLKRIKLYEHRFEIENQDILDSFKRGDAPEIWHKPEARIPLGGFEGFNKWVEAHGHPKLSSEELLNLNEYPKILYDETFLYPGESPKPKDSWEVERAVVGYEEPKPIDTIEKKHELRIQALEAEIKNLYRLLNGKADKTIYGTR